MILYIHIHVYTYKRRCLTRPDHLTITWSHPTHQSSPITPPLPDLSRITSPHRSPRHHLISAESPVLTDHPTITWSHPTHQSSPITPPSPDLSRITSPHRSPHHHLISPDSPVLADLVDEDDVVRLTDGQLSTVRGERQAFHHVTLLAVLPVTDTRLQTPRLQRVFSQILAAFVYCIWNVNSWVCRALKCSYFACWNLVL